MRKYRIFLSHKFEERDRKRADAIEKALRDLSPSIEVYNPGSDITTAKTWRVEINKELANSDLLLLLYADPNQDWSWCTYEAGLFSRLDADPNDIDPIVCIHYVNLDPPSQLEHLQCLEAQHDRVRHFLSDLLRTTDITSARWPLEARVTDEELDSAAEIICDQFRKPDQFFPVFRLELALPSDTKEFISIPDDSRVVNATPGTMALFKLTDDKDRTWADLIATHKGGEWVDEFNKAFAVIARRRIPDPLKSTFLRPRGSEIVRPSIYRMDSYDDKPFQISVVFTPEPAPGKVGGRVFNMLRTLERNKTELINRFLDFSEPSDPTLSSKANLDAIAVAYNLIHDETTQLGVFDPERLKGCFPDPSVFKKLLRLADQWRQTSTLLHKAIESDNRRGVLQQLLLLSSYIDQYARLVSQRYAVLVSRRPSLAKNIDADVQAEETEQG